VARWRCGSTAVVPLEPRAGGARGVEAKSMAGGARAWRRKTADKSRVEEDGQGTHAKNGRVMRSHEEVERSGH
jgi:hypothetical protein